MILLHKNIPYLNYKGVSRMLKIFMIDYFAQTVKRLIVHVGQVPKYVFPLDYSITDAII